MENGEARHIYDRLLQYLEKIGLDKSRLSAFGSDGGSAMVGIHSGVATLLKQNVSGPYLISQLAVIVAKRIDN